MSDETQEIIGDYRYGFHDPENSTIRFDKGLSEQVVRDISELKDEPEWMTDWRLKAYKVWKDMKEPDWANVKYDKPDFQAISYYSAPSNTPKYLSLIHI